MPSTLVVSHSEQINTPGTTALGGGTFFSIFGGGAYSELFWAVGIVFMAILKTCFRSWSAPRSMQPVTPN